MTSHNLFSYKQLTIFGIGSIIAVLVLSMPTDYDLSLEFPEFDLLGGDSVTGGWIDDIAKPLTPKQEIKHVKGSSAYEFDKAIERAGESYEAQLYKLKLKIDNYSCPELIKAYEINTAWTLRNYVAAVANEGGCT